MLTINLEKSLIRENKKLVLPEELLLVNEYDKFTNYVENDALSRIGLNRNLKHGREIKNRIGRNELQAKSFPQERVFHISQIKSTCQKYRLRFLRAQFYRGIIDSELPCKISVFEVAHGVKCDERNTKIMAPMESFELQKMPKDPLLFYQINDEYYYLIHKWGNDLSIFRRAYVELLQSPLFSWLIFPAIFFILSLLLKSGGLCVFAFVIFFASSAFHAIHYHIEREPILFLKKNQWNSEYDNS